MLDLGKSESSGAVDGAPLIRMTRRVLRTLLRHMLAALAWRVGQRLPCTSF
jgi:hypothetical protein